MASRLFSGSKPSKSKSKTRTEPPTSIPSALPKRTTSIPTPSSATAKPGKIPTPSTTSTIPRTKTTGNPTTGNPTAQETSKSLPAPKPSNVPSTTSTSKSDPAARKTSMRVMQSVTASIPRGIEVGMGTRTEIVSTNPPHQRNRLRRKQSSLDQRSRYAQSESSDTTYEPVSHHTASDATSPGGYTDPFPGSILGISMPEPNLSYTSHPQRQTTPTEFATSNSRMASYARNQPHKLSTTDLPPPTPNYAARSSGSSSRYSESPGPFSRTSTPTSASSHSPGVLQAPKFTRIRPRASGSPTRSHPPVTRHKFPGADESGEPQRGLSAVRESQTSSSSSSTVKGVDIEITEAGRIARRADTKTPPTPPLRLSSKRGKSPMPLPTATNISEVEAVPESVQASRLKSAPGSRLARPNQIGVPPSVSTEVPPNKPTLRTLPRPNMPPSRPSRDNVPPLEGREPGVIVKSNLPHLATTGHKRRESAEKIVLDTLQKTEDKGKKLARSGSISSGTGASSKRASITSPHLFPSDQKKENTTLRTDIKTSKSEITTPSSASPSKASSRFGLFSRKIKSPSENSIMSPPEKSEKPDKLVKKGPVAGTGHEGYGKYARRGRSGSTSTAASRARSTSKDRHSQLFARPSSSRKSSFGSDLEKPQIDDFYRDRLEPVVISGGGEIRENRNSIQGMYQSPSGQTSQASVDSSTYQTSRSRVTQDTSAGTSSIASSQRVSRELLPAPVLIPSSAKLPEGRTLAHRRSLLRSQMFGESEATKIPPPINTKVLAPSPALDTYDSTVSSAPRTDDTQDISEGHEGNWLKSKKKKTGDKGKLSRKWNFLYPLRSRSPEKSSTELQRFRSNDSTGTTEVDKQNQPQPVAFYTMMDDVEPEGGDTDLEQRLRNIEGELDFDNTVSSTVLRAEREREMSMLLPSPPKFPTHFESTSRPSSPKVALNQSPPKASRSETEAAQKEEVQLSTTAPVPVRRPSRLQQVGRIPRVVSKRDRLHNPSQQSFSRPFKRLSIDETPERGSQSAVERPALGLQTDLSPAERWNPFAKPASAPPANNILFGMEQDEEFLRFPSRKDSQMSGSSSSGILSLAPITALAPASHQSLGEDDVWDEYDQLLEDVGQGLPSLDSPELESMINSFPSLSNLRSPPPMDKHDSGPLASEGSSDTARAQSPLISKATPGPQLSDLFSTSPTSTEESPSTDETKDSNANVLGKAATRGSITSIESGSRYSTQSMASHIDSISGSRSSIESERTKRVTRVMAEKTQSSHSHSLRFSALMTSRWLSFDRVLFSPAQEEIIMSNPQQAQSRVLVLDGLQNDDWAAYCALTYPDAVVYNLASFSKAKVSNETSNSGTWSPPSNLRRVSHSSIAAPFPFPKGFFAVVVFRFPAASTPSAYKNAISECKRVLRPGGYLELTVLDMDLVNAGPAARRAVRGVKEKIAAGSPEISLSPASDTLMKYLGRRGFENVNRCTVGVPVAGIVQGMLGVRLGVEGTSASSAAENAATGSAAVPSTGASGNASGSATTNTAAGGLSATEANASSLTRLLSGQPGTAPVGVSPDFTGPKMVARVGRWWWSRCYEKAVFGERSPSMWDDKLLVKECEKRETGLRLLVCYAQKPESPRRRTVSV